MDEWENVQRKIRGLQNSLLSSGTGQEAHPSLETLSVSEYWKRRYEQDKLEWEERLRAKEREHSKIQQEFQRDEQGIRELSLRLHGLEEQLQSGKVLWEERLKLKTLESELEKKRIEWESRVRLMEEENGNLREKLRKGAESVEEETKRRQAIEAEKLRMEEELRNVQLQIRMTASEEQKKIQTLEMEKQSLQHLLDELKSTKNAGMEKSAEIEKEMALLHAERNRNLALLAQREKEQFETFEDLARGFAHKVRNYLGIMSGTLQLCMSNFTMDEELKKQVVLVDQNAQEMLKAIEEFLTISKIPEMSFQTLDVNELLANAVFVLEESAKARQVRVEKKFGEGLPPVSMDPRLLLEGLKQLMLNALEASPNGGAITVSSAHEKHSGKVVIRVTDQGKGIQENHIKKIFQPYFTTKKGKKGLGLSLAKRAVDLHHGSLSVSSAKDQGTIITVQIPAQG